jgi:hypothetical protein
MDVSRKPRASNSCQHAQTSPERGAGVLRWRTTLLLFAVLVAGISLGSALGQEQKHRVPGLAKLTAGPNQTAFDGIVQSLDLKRKILNVNTVQGGVTEIFPIQKNVNVVTADGDRRTLAALAPGTNVFILYEQRGDRRTVKQIVILAAKRKAATKAVPPS